MTTTTLPLLRRSAMQTASSCLHRYKQIWVDGTPDHSDFSLRGIAFHSCAHRYITRLVESQLQADAEEARLAFTEGIAAALTPAHLVADVREIYFRWAEHFGLDLKSFLAAEEHQIGKTQHTFTPDLVYGRAEGLEIVDFKTYFHGLTEHQIRADFQARWYVFNAMRIWPHFPHYTFTHSYVRYGRSVSVQFEPSDLATFETEVEAVAATIAEAEARNEWPATAGTECSYCQLRCPLADHPAIIPKRFTLPEQAVKVGGWLLAAETQIRTVKKAYKAYVAAMGPVMVGGVEWANRPSEVRSYPLGDVLRILRDRNVLGVFDGESGLTISHSALSRLFQKFPQLQEDLAPYMQAKTAYRFSARKPGVDDVEDE